MRAVGIIPARLGSTRLKEKVLQLVGQKPMVLHVYEQAKKAKKLDDVIVACDHERVMQCVQKAGGKAVLTREDHPNGTSRVAEVAEGIPVDVFINIQGDEPMIHPENIDRIVNGFEADEDIQMVTLAIKSDCREDFNDPNVVKVVCDENLDALYFSRSGIPHEREKGANFSFLKHLGIYGYRKQFLLNVVGSSATALEKKEKLEQLRILERGHKIRVLETVYDSLSVDTQHDLEVVNAALKAQH